MASNPIRAEVSQLRKPAEQPELAEELARQTEEVLRLRDLLIAKDLELGATRGRAAELEAQSLKMLNLAAHLRSLVPGVVWALVAKLRR